jgi:hypothetical protein
LTRIPARTARIVIRRLFNQSVQGRVDLLRHRNTFCITLYVSEDDAKDESAPDIRVLRRTGHNLMPFEFDLPIGHCTFDRI